MAQVKISNRYLDNIVWESGTTCDHVTDNRVDIWRICISSNLSFLDGFQTIMQPGEIARANRYFQLKDKNRYIVSRGALRTILGDYLNQSPSSVEFAIRPNKKPYIISQGENDLHYNISHSGDWILLAIANSPVGADTEPLKDPFDYQEIMPGYFSADEIHYITQKNSNERFFLLWTRKESLTKATGKGLDENVKFIPCMDGSHLIDSDIISSTNDWSISSFKLFEQYVASVAHSAFIDDLRFWDIDF